MTTPWEHVIRLDERPSALDGFDCNNPEINNWLATHALSQHKQHNVTVWVCLNTRGETVGVFALRTTTVLAPTDLSNTQRKHWGVNTNGFATALMIAQLGLAKHYQGQGYGNLLLREAESKCVESALTVACKLLVVDAQHQGVISFYTSHKYTHVGGDRLVKPLRLTLSDYQHHAP